MPLTGLDSRIGSLPLYESCNTSDVDRVRGTKSRVSSPDFQTDLLPGSKEEVVCIGLNTSVVVDDLRVHLWKGGHTWPPWALNVQANSQGSIGDLV